MYARNKVEIRHETPSVDDYLNLRVLAGLSPMSREGAEIGLRRSCFAVTLLENGEILGMGRVIGDGGCFFQVTDIAVKPSCQGRGLGTIIMKEIREYLDTVPVPSYVSLIADGEAAKLYGKFGFVPVQPKSQGMFLRR